MWKRVGLFVVILAAGALFVYQTRTIFHWVTIFEAGNNAAQILALVVGGVWALNRFIVTRESRTSLEISVGASVVSGDVENLLVQIVIRLKNIGASKITARQFGVDDTFAYGEDDWDPCRHAGTLKIRQVPAGAAPGLFDWYGLTPMRATVVLPDPHDVSRPITAVDGDLEQINYLTDFQDPEDGFRNAHFWLEPNEVYELTVPVRLPRGDYAVKAYFLGDERYHGEEEYWSHTIYCRLEAPSD